MIRKDAINCFAFIMVLFKIQVVLESVYFFKYHKCSVVLNY